MNKGAHNFKTSKKQGFSPGMLVRYIGYLSSGAFLMLGKSSTNSKNFHRIEKGQVGLYIKNHGDTCEEVLFDDVIVTLGSFYLEPV